VRTRLAAPGDAEAIRTIYNHEVTAGTTTFDLVPRTSAEQLAWMERHRGAYPAVVAVAGPTDGSMDGPADGPVAGETVLGFGSLSPYRSRPAYATSVEDSVYVDRAHRRGGVGRAILVELLGLAKVHGFHTVIARIVGDNEGSIRLHRACGFGLVGVEREIGRKHGRWLDVVELQRLL
jgi:phosphinothricin acetyltransferase